MDLPTRLDDAADLLQEHVRSPRQDLGDAAWEGDLPELDAMVAGLTSSFVSKRAELPPADRLLARRWANELADLSSDLDEAEERKLADRLRRMASLIAGSL